MNETYRLIITGMQDYKDYDSIVYGVSEQGKISLLAKGIRKPTSHKAYQLFLFSLVECQCSSKYLNSFPIITSVNVVESNRLLREDLGMQMIAAISCELINNLSEDNYQVLDELFSNLKKNVEPLTAFNYFLSKYLLLSGNQFFVDNCVVCGNTHINSISVNDGGFICTECQKKLHTKIFEIDFLKKFRYIVKSTKVGFDSILKLELDDFNLTLFLLEIIEYHLGIKLRTKEFFIDSYVEFSR